MQETVKFLVLFAALVLAQVLICNNIMLFGVAMPIIFIYLIIRLPMGMNVKWVLTISFLMGFIIDVFSDTPGVNALSCTVLAMLRRPVFKLYTGGDEAFDEVLPCISSLGPAMYAKYMISCTLLYCLLCFSLIYFTFIAFGGLLLKVLASTVLSAALLMGIDGMVGGPRRS